MRQICLILILLLLTSSLVFGTNRVQVTPGNVDWDGYIRWDRKVIAGADSTYSTGSVDAINSADTLFISGASDSAFSRIFYNKGGTSLQLHIWGGTTVRLIVEVQTANCALSAGSTIPDSLFKISQWLTVGTGVANNIISTTVDSITAKGNYGPIRLYIEDSQVWRLLIRSTVDGVGFPRIMVRGFVRKEK